MAQKYKNIPVKPDVYVKVALVADLNNRGLGDQVKEWADNEVSLPTCDHEKQPVSIEIFGDVKTSQKALYCPICKRVYAQETA